MKVKFCKTEVEYPSEKLGELRDSSDLLGNRLALKDRLRHDGYLLLRNFLDREIVQGARKVIVEYLDEKSTVINEEQVHEIALPVPGKEVSVAGQTEITHHPSVQAVYEDKKLFDFFALLFGEDAVVSDYKCLRIVSRGSFTGCHSDIVYMGKSSRRMNSVWIPIGDVPVYQGTLAICEGLHDMESYSRIMNVYRGIDTGRGKLKDGWLTTDPYEITEKFGGRWLTTEFNPGDILIFGPFTMHASTANMTEQFRISCDIRFQPASEPPDDRIEEKSARDQYTWGNDTSL